MRCRWCLVERSAPNDVSRETYREQRQRVFSMPFVSRASHCPVLETVDRYLRRWRFDRDCKTAGCGRAAAKPIAPAIPAVLKGRRHAACAKQVGVRAPQFDQPAK